MQRLDSVLSTIADIRAVFDAVLLPQSELKRTHSYHIFTLSESPTGRIRNNYYCWQ